MTDAIRFTEKTGAHGVLGDILLQRPEAFNALTLEMCQALHQQLKLWAADDRVFAVVIRSDHPKAFCAGGDIRWLYEQGQKNPEAAAAFTRCEYAMNLAISQFPKPYIALMDGITMGGGVGVSIHGSHRVASDRTLFAMPETGIGFFPDVGASHFLNRCPGETGLYLALTGQRLRAADLLFTGLADYCVPHSEHAAVLERLQNLNPQTDVFAQVTDCLQRDHLDPGESRLAAQQTTIDTFFAADALDQLFQQLTDSEAAWAQETAQLLRQKSPTSLWVTQTAMRQGRSLDLADCLAMEHGVSRQFFQTPDFYEGVRAVVIDKDQAPKWSPNKIEAVTTQAVASFFSS